MVKVRSALGERFASLVFTAVAPVVSLFMSEGGSVLLTNE
jgi:hypothetical protein